MIDVVAAVVMRDGKYMIARRATGKHLAGYWEFPGGKVEPGELLAQALSREILEELNIQVVAHSPLIEIAHDYGDKRVLLDVHGVTEFSGIPRPMESQPMRWVPTGSLKDFEFPAANVAIIDALLAAES